MEKEKNKFHVTGQNMKQWKVTYSLSRGECTSSQKQQVKKEKSKFYVTDHISCQNHKHYEPMKHNFNVTKLHHYQFASQLYVKPGTFMARLTGGFTFKVKSYFCNTHCIPPLCIVHICTHSCCTPWFPASSRRCVGGKHLNP